MMTNGKNNGCKWISSPLNIRVRGDPSPLIPRVTRYCDTRHPGERFVIAPCTRVTRSQTRRSNAFLARCAAQRTCVSSFRRVALCSLARISFNPLATLHVDGGGNYVRSGKTVGELHGCGMRAERERCLFINPRSLLAITDEKSPRVSQLIERVIANTTD